MPDFSHRSTEIEVMDDLNSSGKIIDQTLQELETINLLLGGNHVTVNGIARLLKNAPRDKKITIADLGCGSGDILRLIHTWTKKRGFDVSLVGVDANPAIVDYARKHTQVKNITFESVNIFSDAFKSKTFDIVVGTLFFHHFTNEELVAFFSQLKKQIRIGMVINDIHRHWFAFYSIKWLTQLFSRSSMVKNDAPVSVMRAFLKKDLEDILKQAGIAHYTIRWMWAFRWQVVIDFRLN